MAKFVQILVGAAVIIGTVAFVLSTGGFGAIVVGSVEASLIGGLLASGASMLIAGVGTAISSAVGGSASVGSGGGIAAASRNPVKSWDVVYGRACVGGTIIHIQSFKDSDAYLDLVIVVAAHSIASVDSLLFDKQIVQLNSNLGIAVDTPFNGSMGDSFSPAQAVASIQHIARSNGIVACTLNQPIPLLYVGDKVKVQGITGDRTLNGTWRVDQITLSTPTLQTYTFISGGADSIVDLQGQTVTLWPDYGKKIHIEVLTGNQTSTFWGMLNGTPRDADYTNLVQFPDNPWTDQHIGFGKAMVWLRLHYDATVFSGGIPAISFLIHGKNDILDPRKSPPVTTYTENAILCIADYCANTLYGFGVAYGVEMPLPQLNAAASVCDEAVPLAAGETEPRYACNGHFSLDAGRGRILQNMLTSCGGRLNIAGGLWVFQPAAWYGSTPAPGPTIGQMTGRLQWKPTPSIRDLYNGVKGVYVSPSNNWQAGDVPPYAMDSIHGYGSSSGSAAWSATVSYAVGAAVAWGGIGYIAILPSKGKQPDANPNYWAQHYQDVLVDQDLGQRRWLDAQYPFTISSATAQRLEKIELLRRRQFGSGTFPFNMTAYSFVTFDVIELNLPIFGWNNKLLEVTAKRFTFGEQSGPDGATIPIMGVELDLSETSSQIYDWSPTEELTPQGFQQATLPSTYQPAPPTNLVLESDAFTAQPVAGLIQDAILVSWTAPVDAYVTEGGRIEIQYRGYIAPVTEGTISISTAGVATFSSTVLSPAFTESTLVVMATSPAQIFTLLTVTSSTAGTVIPSPKTAITGSTYVMTADPPWIGLPSVNPSVTNVPIAGVVDGQEYEVEIRSVNGAGVPSVWVVGTVVATGSRAPLPWQPGAETPIPSDPVTQDLNFSMTIDYAGPDASGIYTPQIDIGGYPPINQPGAAPTPDVSSMVVTTSNTGGFFSTGSYCVSLEAYDNTSAIRPGCSLPSPPAIFSFPAGVTAGSITLSGFVFGVNTQGYRVFIGSGTGDMASLSQRLSQPNPGTLPTTITVPGPAVRSFGPTDPDADHFHIQAFALQHGGVWAMPTDGAVVSGVLHIPGTGFDDNQFQGYTVELLPGGNGVGSPAPIIHGVIASHVGDDFTLVDSTGWVTMDGDLILCHFKLASVSENSFSDPNIDNAQEPGGNTPDLSAGALAWVMTGNTVEQIQTIQSNGPTDYTINGTFDPPITLASQILIVYPVPVFDSGALPPFKTLSDSISDPIPTIGTIPTDNDDNLQLVIRVFTESTKLTIDSTRQPARIVYVAPKASVGTSPDFPPISQ